MRDWRLAEETRQDVVAEAADAMAAFLDGVERDRQRDARRFRREARQRAKFD